MPGAALPDADDADFNDAHFGLIHVSSVVAGFRPGLVPILLASFCIERPLILVRHDLRRLVFFEELRKIKPLVIRDVPDDRGRPAINDLQPNELSLKVLPPGNSDHFKNLPDCNHGRAPTYSLPCLFFHYTKTPTANLLLITIPFKINPQIH